LKEINKMKSLLLDILKEIEDLDIAGNICAATVGDLYKKIETIVTDEDVRDLSAAILYHTKEQLALINIDNTINYLHNTNTLAKILCTMASISNYKDYSVIPNENNTKATVDMVYSFGSLCYSYFDGNGCSACPIKKSGLLCTGIMDLTDLYVARRDTILRMCKIREARKILIRQYELYSNRIIEVLMTRRIPLCGELQE